MAITMDELDIAPKAGPQYKPAPLNTTAELIAALDNAVAQSREAGATKTASATSTTPCGILGFAPSLPPEAAMARTEESSNFDDRRVVAPGGLKHPPGW
jgi:hypothetical protein